jgi:hypothetical protein
MNDDIDQKNSDESESDVVLHEDLEPDGGQIDEDIDLDSDLEEEEDALKDFSFGDDAPLVVEEEDV